MILLAGPSFKGQSWVGCMGNLYGHFQSPFLDIPPDRAKPCAHMRYHEFFRIEGRIRVVENASPIWDIPEFDDARAKNAWAHGSATR